MEPRAGQLGRVHVRHAGGRHRAAGGRILLQQRVHAAAAGRRQILHAAAGVPGAGRTARQVVSERQLVAEVVY